MGGKLCRWDDEFMFYSGFYRGRFPDILIYFLSTYFSQFSPGYLIFNDHVRPMKKEHGHTLFLHIKTKDFYRVNIIKNNYCMVNLNKDTQK